MNERTKPAGPTQPTVYIVDDDASVRDSTAMFLELNGLRTQVFASAEDFLVVAAQELVGCLLLDQRMQGLSGLDLQQELTRRRIGLPVIIMTAHGDVASTRQALKAGALDFLEKPVEHDVLLDVVTAALAEADGRLRREREQKDRQARVNRLTDREREVMLLLAQGLHNRDIAEKLDISPRTVEVYKARMMEKLQTRSLADVIRLVLAEKP